MTKNTIIIINTNNIHMLPYFQNGGAMWGHRVGSPIAEKNFMTETFTRMGIKQAGEREDTQSTKHPK